MTYKQIRARHSDVELTMEYGDEPNNNYCLHANKKRILYRAFRLRSFSLCAFLRSEIVDLLSRFFLEVDLSLLYALPVVTACSFW